MNVRFFSLYLSQSNASEFSRASQRHPTQKSRGYPDGPCPFLDHFLSFRDCYNTKSDNIQPPHHKLLLDPFRPVLGARLPTTQHRHDFDAGPDQREVVCCRAREDDPGNVPVKWCLCPSSLLASRYPGCGSVQPLPGASARSVILLCVHD
jgi:hypothetical protein